MARKKPTDVVYVHDPQEGRFVVGVPRRDLTQADVERLGPIAVSEALATGLYRKATKTEAEKAAKETEKAAQQTAKAEDGER